MPLSPSMKVMALRHAAVFMNAGSYVIRPKSSPETLILRRSVARMVPSAMGTSYVFSVRLSVMVRVLLAIGRVNLSPSHHGDGRRDDGRRFRAKAARPELCEGAVVGSGRLQFCFGEAAF